MHQKYFASLLIAVLAGCAQAAPDTAPIVVSKDPRGEIRVAVGLVKPVAKNMLLVHYRMTALETAASPPVMRDIIVSSVCMTETRKAVKAVLTSVSTHYFVGGKFVQDREDKHNPPMDLPLDQDTKFTADPANAACSQAVDTLME